MLRLLDKIPSPRGVIHVGAHIGQELGQYRSLRVPHICCIEPQPHAFVKLAENAGPDVALFKCALGAESGERVLHVASNGGVSSSLLRPKRHLELHPKVRFETELSVPVRRLDSLPLDFSKFSLLVADVQGGELELLLGAGCLLSGFDHLILEVQTIELYEGGALLEQLQAWLTDQGFCLSGVHWWTRFWGDALFTNTRMFGDSSSSRP